VRLTDNPGQDKNPAVSVRIATEYFYPICLLWETNRDGNLNIYSKFYTGIGDSVWDDTIFPVTKDAGIDSNPSVALDRNGTFWAVWQSNRTGNWDIFVSSFTGDTWTTPYQLTTDNSMDINPSIAVYNDSLWVAWQTNRDGKWNIYGRMYNGTLWSAPFNITNSDTGNHTNPVIYSNDISIYCAYENDVNGNKDIYLNDLLMDSIMQITSDTFPDEMPVITDGYLVWQSLRTGNYDIFGYNLLWGNIDTITTDAGEDINPSVIDLPIVAKGIPSCTVWETDRRGNRDIYSNLGGYDTTIPVDTNVYNDINPVITATSDTNHYYWVWVLWESERDGNKEIYGTYRKEWEGGISEEMSEKSNSPVEIYWHSGKVIFSIPYSSNLNVKVFNIIGQLVYERHLGYITSGKHIIPLKFLHSGIYFIQIKTKRDVIKKKIINVK